MRREAFRAAEKEGKARDPCVGAVVCDRWEQPGSSSWKLQRVGVAGKKTGKKNGSRFEDAEDKKKEGKIKL